MYINSIEVLRYARYAGYDMLAPLYPVVGSGREPYECILQCLKSLWSHCAHVTWGLSIDWTPAPPQDALPSVGGRRGHGHANVRRSRLA